jgi:8-oxo-dGTP pyrophosphatase MutT (NUDIX family)
LLYINQIKKTTTKQFSIIGKERYLNSAVLVPIIVLDNKEFLLFEKRSLTVRQPGEISFPGGHFDSSFDTTFSETAVRETCEELGITKEKIDLLGSLGTLVAPMGVIVEAFIGTIKINSISDFNFDKKEVDGIFLIPLEYFIENNPIEYFTRLELYPYIIKENGEREELLPVKELGLPERYSLPWGKGKHRVLVYKTDDVIIWGITAELIFELINKLKETVDK